MFARCNARIILILIAFASTHALAQRAGLALNGLADRFVDQQLQYDPTLAYFTGLPSRDNSRFADRSPQGLAAYYSVAAEDLKALLALKIEGLASQDRATYANLRERLESDLQVRVCKAELWNVNHFNGWQSQFAEVAARQPVDTAEERRQALRRWGSVPGYLNVEKGNLRAGLTQGYSAPASVVRRVVQQMSALAVATPEQSVFYSPARRSDDSAFQAAFRQLIVRKINPALQAYRDFLQREYLPKAREGIAMSDLPNGTACYQAFLRSSTTLQRSPQQVFDLGKQTVEENATEIRRIGLKDYGTADLRTILAKIRGKPSERFQSTEDLLMFSQLFLQRTKDVTAASLIDSMPHQDVVIRPLSAFEENAGVGSRFQQEPNLHKPAVFLIKLSDWKTETHADAEITTVHETVPGHFIQKALARELQPPTRLSRLIDNDAYAEGWARYAESLGEESSIYDTDDAAVMRRLWPAHGMVVDPGMHVFHWTRQHAIDYIVSSGHFTAEVANDYVDRIAVMPGQLTSYDSGGLEIKMLRAEAEAKLGARFDLRRFNRAVLEEGVVPLMELRAHLETWITSELPPH